MCQEVRLASTLVVDTLSARLALVAIDSMEALGDCVYVLVWWWPPWPSQWKDVCPLAVTRVCCVFVTGVHVTPCVTMGFLVCW